MRLVIQVSAQLFFLFLCLASAIAGGVLTYASIATYMEIGWPLHQSGEAAGHAGAFLATVWTLPVAFLCLLFSAICWISFCVTGIYFRKLLVERHGSSNSRRIAAEFTNIVE